MTCFETFVIKISNLGDVRVCVFVGNGGRRLNRQV